MSSLHYFSYEGYGEKAKKDYCYSQAVRVGDVIECSGQGGWDRTTEKIDSNITKQIQQAFDNVEHTIKQAGGKGWEDVFFLRSLHTVINDEAIHAMIDCLKRYCAHQPCWTALGVPMLAFEDMKVEIEVRAHVPVDKK